ncbi:MAG: hypothetical protein ACR2NW_03920 [Thermodesulfobacteriota bacterium]
MKNLTYISIVLFLITATFSFNHSHAINQNTTESFEELVTNPSEYDKKEIIVEGTINKLKFTTADGGKPYTLFKITDDKNNMLHVYYQGEYLKLKKGSVVTVFGEFLKQKRYSFYSFKNVVKAKDVIVET